MRYDDVDDPNYNDTNCGPAMAGYTTPDEKEIERLEARVKELEHREINALFAGDPLEMKAKLQSVRELAEMVQLEKSIFYAHSSLRESIYEKLEAKAREVLEKIK